MREGPAIAVRRADYAPPPYRIRTVELGFDLDAAKTLVTSRLSIEREPGAAVQALRLHAEQITLLRVLVDGQSVGFRHDGSELVIDEPPAAPSFTLEIRNTVAPERNTALSGLYASGGGLFTQCEAEGFRRITCFIDRPDVMAVYTVTLRADKSRYPVLLANGNLVDSGDLDGGRHYARWHDPHPKPSYLFALVAADLVAREQRIRSRAGGEHLLQVWVRRSDLGKTEHALRSLVAAVAWDEARFGLALDLERFMVVAVDDFNMGAMENKGLNLFNTRYVLASPATATDDDYDGIESVVGHEYFHNWSGNRVTCRDWFQLSLKEGLTVWRDQEFSADMAADPAPPYCGAPSPATRAVRRIADVRQLRQLQFAEDAGPMAHPVRPDSYVEINNFYTATVYEKGAEVVRMAATLVGHEGFARGLALYFRRHDGQAVTCDDFMQAIADANPGSALALRLEAFKRWYAQAGTPQLQARGTHDAATRSYTLTLAQRCAPTPGQPEPQPLVIPVGLGLVGRDGAALPLRLAPDAEAVAETLLVLDAPSASWTFHGVDDDPVPSVLRGFSAPVQLDDGLADADLLVLLAHDPDPFNRWEAGQRLGLVRMQRALAAHALPHLDEPYVEAMRQVLRHPRLAPAFKELVLTLPAEAYVAQTLPEVDPPRLQAVREALRAQLAARLHADWVWAWEQHQVHEGYRPDATQAGRRALANLALAMLCLHAGEVGDPLWPGRAYQRVKDAGNMTDRLGALRALLHAHAALAGPALERFHALLRAEPLALDKWFALQAGAPERGGATFERVRALLAHPDYTPTNPNRVRSLLHMFCLHNPAALHRGDGAGVRLWAERVLELDARNPQLAARLARALDRWRPLAEPYRTQARLAIERVAAHPPLSNDVREVLSRALEVA